MLKSITFNERYIVEPWGSTPNPNAISKRLKNPRWRPARPNMHDCGTPNSPEYITYTYIPLFRKGLKIEFKEGLNLMVGENGVGKSQLFKLIDDIIDPNKRHDYSTDKIELDVKEGGGFIKVDPENDSPQNLITPNPASKDFIQDSLMVMGSREQSHGENTQFILDLLPSIEANTILIDEPEVGLSLANQHKYLKSIKTLSETKQVVLITHSKYFMESVERLYDFDKHKWTDSKKYIAKKTS